MSRDDVCRSLAAGIAALGLTLPFLLVTIPPVTDLPQQAAQIRLFAEALQHPDGDYRIQWCHPNQLGYLPVALGWHLGGPLAAGRLGLLIVGLLWIAALHGLARARGRAPGAALLATLFFFNHATYWGFLNFLTGLPVFVLWLLLGERLPPTPGWRYGCRLLLGATLLYAAHVLWLAAGLLWLVAATATARLPWRSVLARLAWTSPVMLAVVLWYPRLEAAGFASETYLGHSPLARLAPGWLLGSAFGGLEGQVEPLLALVVLAWLALGLWQHRHTLAAVVDRRLLLAAVLFLAAAFCLPGVAQHTIFFASRWLPIGVVFLLLAAPSPRLGRLLDLALPGLTVAALSLATAVAWLGFERHELEGLPAALAALPPESQVLGLDLVRTSERIQGYPFYHLYAYAQVEKGGTLNRSFANEASSLVVFRDLPRQHPWTDGLDWRADRLRRSDVEHFSHVLVHGGPDLQAFFERDPRLVAVTPPARWRLYRRQ